MSRSTPLLPIIITGFVIALALAALQLATKSAALALVFPWRISVILVPVSVSMLLARGVLGLVGVFERVSVEARNRIPLLSAAIVLILMLVGSVRFILDLERQASAEARPVMTFVARTKAPLDVYLVPIKMQDFRIASGAPIFVDFKSIPYQEAEVLEWYRRIQRAEGFYEAKEPDCSLLQHFSAAEGVSHVVLERDFKLRECDFMQELYRDEVYAVYRLEEP